MSLNGAAGLSLLPESWALDIKNAALFYLDKREKKMKWKTFYQIICLLVIAGIVFYIFVPKYKYKIEYLRAWRVNIYTGAVEEYNTKQEKWIRYKL